MKTHQPEKSKIAEKGMRRTEPPGKSLGRDSLNHEAMLKAVTALNDLSASNKPFTEIPEIIYQWAFDELGDDEIVSAQQEFQHLTGKFFSDDDFYGTRIRYFIEYFLFERLQKFAFLNHLTCPLYAFYQIADPGALDKKILHALLEIRNNEHSLFQILKSDQNSIYIRDLLFPESPIRTIEPAPNQFFVGLEKNDIFQSHIFRLDHRYHLSDGLILHSKKSLEVLNRIAKNNKKHNEHSKLKFLFHCASGQLTMIRRKSISSQYAYGEFK